ncbi:thiopeptide-type bacteriocin biosynthesis protein [Protofrankia symbiont of Coriaria ruscifolia]|uniref:thiopeptide-type bacteriocin biosynthesis protein n=1 Tax=Protofrankia symbiont of Coriaria ruscifolia TaxID=1306542 RepID=UPI001A9435E2|nr:thiopeptide-type bacteriocin biosynthesis protein [Protofrankia symbiont of Coriaria ruscifolia]
MYRTNITAKEVEEAVLAVLAGTPTATAASRAGMDAADLAEAASLYQQAGRMALEAQIGSARWHQILIEFTDHKTAEDVAKEHLLPTLRQAETDGLISSWWYIRKFPCWRLRLHAGKASPAYTQKIFSRALDGLTSRQLIVGWRPGIYEAETCAFGGPTAMRTAHRIFHADSRAFLEYIAREKATEPPARMLGRREISVLLCSALLRAAGQDWHEQGDVWHRITRMRHLPSSISPDQLHSMQEDLRRLMTLDTHPASPLVAPGGPLAFARPWLTAFTETGDALATEAHTGTLKRGLRDILSQHIIFHWNRIGLADQTQSTLAHVAYETIMGAPA